MNTQQITTAKVLHCRDSNEFQSIIESIPHFKCYGCIKIKPIAAFGRFYTFQDFNQSRNYAVCHSCCERIEAIEDELIQAIKIHLAQRNALRELYPPGYYPAQVNGTEQDIWTIGYQEGGR